MENHEAPKEKIEAFEALSKYDQTSSVDGAPNVYVRPNKDQEIDLLWQNFKVNSNSGKASFLYLIIGFIIGALTVWIINTCANSFSMPTNKKVTSNVEKKADKILEETTVPITDDYTTDGATKTYTVQSGDTVENIIIKFYGSYSPSKADAIRDANNLSDLNKLQIGQTLVIPMN